MSIGSRTSPQVAEKLRLVLAVDTAVNTKMLGELLRNVAPCEVITAVTVAEALHTAREKSPSMIFVGHTPGGVDGVDFTHQLRRSDMECREAPVLMTSNDPTESLIAGAKDAGVHEFLRRPFSMGDLALRLEAAAGRAREWVEIDSYVGPDQRLFGGPDKPAMATLVVKTDDRDEPKLLMEVMRAMHEAIAQLDTQPLVARSKLSAQADILSTLYNVPQAARLALAAETLKGRIMMVAEGGEPAKKVLRACIDDVLNIVALGLSQVQKPAAA